MTDSMVTSNLKADQKSLAHGTDCPRDSTSREFGSPYADNKTLHPFVYWSQSGSVITLKVPLTEVKDPLVQLKESQTELRFSARGRGAHGLQQYEFAIDLFSSVDSQFECKETDLSILIILSKQERGVKWPRLTRQHTKLAWLRVDFARFIDELDTDISDSGQSEDDDYIKERQSYEVLKQRIADVNSQKRDAEVKSKLEETQLSWPEKLDKIYKSNTDIFNPFKKRFSKKKETSTMKYDYRKENATMDSGRNTARRALGYKRAYLFLYNLAMFVMFLSVYIILLIKGLSGKVDDDTIQGAARLVRILTYTQLLESIHPILGLVPGGPLMPLTQVSGRLLCNYFLTNPVIRTDSSPFGLYLFIVWSSIELFRYSFYALRVYKIDIYPITWCRYSLFMPLYPMGGLCESMILYSTIKHYEETGGLSISLPNSANISFSLPVFLRIYVYLLLFPTIYYLMRYMWTQRCKQLKEKAA